ncbi:MFS-type transporter involved in bile tolerance (Atg22 family) [Sediminihabitans luteus]|uniref:MFS-type transporter involved in bile tolerance (Atg22 family) n=1 Tax=Sediminihabitans luteus TaxID=1138585 RepID=A0A2M9D1B9_9CELL|nr:MFS transporter [Sediminihabitans luteus]PJJ77979.1 MFS-type transporter involved in bile tolerance (Atg22 family) [Sediminihabitans luteus]GIJ00610.1 MFS transporter [Sediminihabitans luteus]
MGVVRELRSLVGLPGFRRLFAVRLVSQAGDGAFQVGLATLFFFSPESQSTAGAVAVAFAVLLLPFTVVGPFAGVLLDRWRRRQVLVVGNLVRVVLTLGIAAIMLVEGVGPWVYVLALVNLSVNRFLLAALSASLPRVVDGPLLLTANSLTPTLGTAAAALGGGVGFVVGLVMPAGNVKDSISLALAGGLVAVAALLATRIGRDELGPEQPLPRGQVGAELVRVVREMADGARYLWRRRTPGQALLVMGVHRFIYGMTFVASILIARNLLADPDDTQAGLATFGAILGASALGFGLAIVLTPTLSPSIGPQRWIVVMLCLGAASQTLLAVTLTWATMLVGAVLLGLAVQGAKIAADTIVQRDADDHFRGRAFSLYDVLYNAAFVGAAALGAVVLPDTGYSSAVFFALAAGYALTALVMGTRGARTAAPVPG